MCASPCASSVLSLQRAPLVVSRAASADGRATPAFGPAQELHLGRRSLRPVGARGVSTAPDPAVHAQKLARLRIQDPDAPTVPRHGDDPSDPTWARLVVRARHLDVTASLARRRFPSYPRLGVLEAYGCRLATNRCTMWRSRERRGGCPTKAPRSRTLELAATGDARRLGLERIDAVISGQVEVATSGGDHTSARVVPSAPERRARLLGVERADKHPERPSPLEAYLAGRGVRKHGPSAC